MIDRKSAITKEKLGKIPAGMTVDAHRHPGTRDKYRIYLYRKDLPPIVEDVDIGSLFFEKVENKAV